MFICAFYASCMQYEALDIKDDSKILVSHENHSQHFHSIWPPHLEVLGCMQHLHRHSNGFSSLVNVKRKALPVTIYQDVYLENLQVTA